MELRERGGGGRRGRRWRERGEGGGGGSRFIARSREASTEHSFNQTVTSPPGAARRLENRSLLGSLPRLRFCSHAPRLSSERCAGSDGTFLFFFFFNPSASGGGEKNKRNNNHILSPAGYEAEHERFFPAFRPTRSNRFVVRESGPVIFY